MFIEVMSDNNGQCFTLIIGNSGSIVLAFMGW